VPGIVVAAPKDGRELCDLMHTALRHEEGPFAIRYPRDTIPDDLDLESIEKIPVHKLAIGRWEWLHPGESLILLAVGSQVVHAMTVAERLEVLGESVGVVNCRFVKPMDEELLRDLLLRASFIVTLEEGNLDGGFGASVARFAQQYPSRARLLHLGLPDSFIEHGKRSILMERVGLSSDRIYERIAGWILGHRGVAEIPQIVSEIELPHSKR
jgi:1-deoxy-D-xylulose-5-phosphate synthase